MDRIFISYRTEDSQDATGRIHDHLDMYFGPDITFRDIDSIRGGADFQKVLDHALSESRLVLAVIGPRWLEVQNQGGRRLDDPHDLVRLELKTALERTAVIPVLVSFASMPKPDDLPSDLRGLAAIQSISVPPDHNFTRGMRELVEQIHTLTAVPYGNYPGLLRESQRLGLVTIKNSFAEDRTVLEEVSNSRELIVVMNDGPLSF